MLKFWVPLLFRLTMINTRSYSVNYKKKGLVKPALVNK